MINELLNQHDKYNYMLFIIPNLIFMKLNNTKAFGVVVTTYHPKHTKSN